MADKYLLQAEQAIREEDYEGARAAMEKILSLQAEHDLTLPEEFHFKYAQVAALEDLPEQALEAVVKYLAAAGREGQHYVEALELMNTVQAAASCKGWNAEEYFETATLEQVTACLDTGVDLEAQNDPDGTPLHRAASRTENLAVIEALLLAGADLEAKDEYSKWTPLHEAARSNRNPAAIEALLLAGADLEARKRRRLHAPASGGPEQRESGGGRSPARGRGRPNYCPVYSGPEQRESGGRPGPDRCRSRPDQEGASGSELQAVEQRKNSFGRRRLRM